MQRTVVALTGDTELGVTLNAAVDGDESADFEFITDADHAIERLQSAAIPTILIDTRRDYFTRQAESLIPRLAQGELPAVNLITVGDAFYPSSVAAELDLLVDQHINLAPGQHSELLQCFHRMFQVTDARPIPESRHVRARDVSITTYTPDFFPVVDDIIRVSSREVTLLLVGETGTGKTTLAKFVHELSPRRDRQFQDLACGALPSDLIESELFGHTRGAFTGADRNKTGRFEAAGHGTLLLDEIDVLDLKQQTKLLKVIETGQFEMVGSTETRQSEARLIVASNVNLQELVDGSRFRSDLYYRLNVLEFRLPSLRHRPLDVAVLAMQFVEELCEEHDISVTRVHRDFLDALRQHDWPGNLRELKNHIRRAVLFSHHSELTVNDLSHKVIQSQFTNGTRNTTPTQNGWKLADRVAQSERAMLEDALRANNNNRTRTAKALGISRVGLYKKMRRLGLLEEAS